jgi:hypothetical protein
MVSCYLFSDVPKVLFSLGVCDNVMRKCWFNKGTEFLDSYYYYIRVIALYELWLSLRIFCQIFKPFSTFGSILWTGHRPLARRVPAQDTTRISIHASSVIRTHNPSDHAAPVIDV